MSEGLPAVACIAWGIGGAAYAAVCVWLGVRLFNRRERWVRRMAVALALMPVLYTASSGPMAMVAFHSRNKFSSTVFPNGKSTVQATTELDVGYWFPIVYAPLFMASDAAWGDLVFEYWMLFPHQVTLGDP